MRLLCHWQVSTLEGDDDVEWYWLKCCEWNVCFYHQHCDCTLRSSSIYSLINSWVGKKIVIKVSPPLFYPTESLKRFFLSILLRTDFRLRRKNDEIHGHKSSFDTSHHHRQDLKWWWNNERIISKKVWSSKSNSLDLKMKQPSRVSWLSSIIGMPSNQHSNGAWCCIYQPMTTLITE